MTKRNRFFPNEDEIKVLKAITALRIFAMGACGVTQVYLVREEGSASRFILGTFSILLDRIIYNKEINPADVELV